MKKAHTSTFPQPGNRFQVLILELLCGSSFAYNFHCSSQDTSAKIEALTKEMMEPSRPLERLRDEEVVGPGMGCIQKFSMPAPGTRQV